MQVNASRAAILSRVRDLSIEEVDLLDRAATCNFGAASGLRPALQTALLTAARRPDWADLCSAVAAALPVGQLHNYHRANATCAILAALAGRTFWWDQVMVPAQRANLCLAIEAFALARQTTTI